MTLHERSSHLAGALRRAIDPLREELFEEVFAYTIADGGEDELGFERLPGVSFNPRCARVALILLQDGGVRDQSILAAGILAASDAPLSYQGSEAATLHRLLSSALGAWEEAPSAEGENGGRLIRAAMTIDLGRHLHQLKDHNSTDYLRLFLADITAIVNDPRGIPEKMITLLRHIYSRQTPFKPSGIS